MRFLVMALLVPAVLWALGVACGSDGGPRHALTAMPSPSGLSMEDPPFSSVPHKAPPPQATLTALASEIDFDHPSGTVTWDGPDKRVNSQGDYHCGAEPALRDAFHVPSLLRVKYTSATFSLIAPTLVATPSDLVWTSYAHGDWQLWRSGDSSVLYLIDSPHSDTAFEYHFLGCD